MAECKLTEDEHKHMDRAFLMAEEALRKDEVPVGCVFIYNGMEIADGHNDVNRTKNPTRHAEMVAIEKLKIWCTVNNASLEEIFPKLTLFVTIEPCIMCACAMYHLKLKKIVYGAANERFGGLGSVGSREKYAVDHYIELVPGIGVDRAVKLLKDFYDKQNPFCPVEKRKVKKPKVDQNEPT